MMVFRKFSRSLSLAAIVVALGACSTTGGRNAETWDLYRDSPRVPGRDGNMMQSGAVRAVFFRVANEGQRANAVLPVNLYINNHYQASLIDNSYTEAFVCPGQVRLSLQSNDVNFRYETKREGSLYPVAASPSVQYFEVYRTDSGAVGIRATATAAPASMKLRQDHTISRVVVPQCTGN